MSANMPSALGLAAALALVTATAGGCVSEDSAELLLLQKANATRGGALWDTWWKVPGVKDSREPGTGATEENPAIAADNPLYVARANNSRRGSQTWRCKECHGWDYKGASGVYGSGSHKTGFAGVLASAGKSAAELHRIIRDGGGLGQGHTFGTVLSETDIADVVKFIKEGTVDDVVMVDPATKASKGDAEKGKERYEATCAACHGDDGKKINFKKGAYASEYAYDVASDNPWEFIHKVRFGQPGTNMPNAITKAYLFKDVADILAYVQTLAPAALAGASIPRGGVLWDEWWKVNGAQEPGSTNTLYQDPTYNTAGNTRAGSQTWRCKECHGWDYKGRDGAYGSGSHKTGIAGVFGSRTKSVAALTAAIADGVFAGGATAPGHKFQQDGILSSGDVKDLVLFIREGLVDDDTYISRNTKKSTGNATVGRTLYSGSCTVCHGEDGRRVNFAHDDGVPKVEYVADVARDNPWELTHKVRFGQPGSDEESVEMFELLGLRFGHMPNKFDLGISEDQVAAIVAHAQTLPGSAERGGQLWDTWWKVSYVTQGAEPGSATSTLAADNPYYVANASSSRRGSQTWRCKECHGWDLKGVDGAYGSGSHRTGFPGVMATRGKGAQVFYDAIFSGQFTDGAGMPTTTDASHAFGSVLGDAAVRDLVNFTMGTYEYSVELVGRDGDLKKVRKDYDSNTMQLRTRDADKLFGQLKFQMNCATCHGLDGRAINFSKDEEEYVGTIARDNPVELISKIRSGQPGSVPMMPAAVSKRYTIDDIADILLFAQDLP